MEEAVKDETVMRTIIRTIYMYTTTTNVIKYPLYIMQNALMIMVGLQWKSWYL